MSKNLKNVVTYLLTNLILILPISQSQAAQYIPDSKLMSTVNCSQAASFVIARRGLLSYEKMVNVKFKDKKTGVVTASKKPVTVVNKEKTISIGNSKHYGFDLPARNNQGLTNAYWKEIEQSYRKMKKKRSLLQKSKRESNKQLVLAKLETLDLASEISLVADNFGEYRNPSTTFIPF